MIEIDGSFGEGGGQILRTAYILSAVTGKPCRISNIRRSRLKPGLANQHLLGIQSLAYLCNGRVEGASLSSEEINFYPKESSRERNSISINIETAESITLLLQTLLPFSLLAPSPIRITIKGGATDAFFSPTLDYFQHCFLKILEKIGAKVEINILRRGYYPEGGAEIEVMVYPSKLKGINLQERGEFKKILLFSGASESLKPKLVAERQSAGVKEILGKLNLPIEEKIEYYDTQCPGSQVCLVCEFENTVIGVDNIGKLGKRSEDTGKETALEILKEQKSEACLDKHMASQILPYLSLAENESHLTVSEITKHCKSNIWVIEKFLERKFEIKDNLIILK